MITLKTEERWEIQFHNIVVVYYRINITKSESNDRELGDLYDLANWLPLEENIFDLLQKHHFFELLHKYRLHRLGNAANN